ncbi:uncharacterized protein LOC131302534 isoform X2 [Rhododendron vialii]|uniref:uncharacterized protein LOC131302534 isoform X2 n=1 Tax=Rhododendron vialii TaxID=182163 RepID=UPI00265F6E42|nr:uncharacterized protein LOC131302534 isoform X2 [Rhododendron vialii]
MENPSPATTIMTDYHHRVSMVQDLINIYLSFIEISSLGQDTQVFFSSFFFFWAMAFFFTGILTSQFEATNDSLKDCWANYFLVASYNYSTLASRMKVMNLETTN